jgi:all-trans-8'-apo-beta-carotenal 15,15'-oxygenase
LDAYNCVMTRAPAEVDVVLPGLPELPAELEGGTWWGNGPGQVGNRLVHPFDGHGYLRALRLGRKQIRLQTAFVRTDACTAEQQAGKPVYLGLATLPSDSWLENLRAPAPRNVANTCVLPRAGNILALWEGGLPHAVDPHSLQTRGTVDFGGELRKGEAFLAHTRWDAARDLLVGLSPHIEGPRTTFVLRSLDRSGALVQKSSVPLDSFTVAHDFAITPNYGVVMDSSVVISPWGMVKALARRIPLIEAVKFSERKARILLIPRAGGPGRVVVLPQALLSVHQANAWEEEERVVLISCAMGSFTFGNEFGWRGPNAPLDFTDDAGNRQKVYRFDIEKDGSVRTRILTDVAIDFPRIRPERDGLPTQHLWGVVTRLPHRPAPFPALAHLDCESGVTTLWEGEPDTFLGEPLVIPRGAAEKDVWLAAMCYAADKTTLFLFDGAALDRGPVFRVPLPVALPYGFHGAWEPPDRGVGSGPSQPS